MYLFQKWHQPSKINWVIYKTKQYQSKGNWFIGKLYNIKVKRTGLIVILYFRKRKKTKTHFFKNKSQETKGSIVNYQRFAIPNSDLFPLPDPICGRVATLLKWPWCAENCGFIIGAQAQVLPAKCRVFGGQQDLWRLRDEPPIKDHQSQETLQLVILLWRREILDGLNMYYQNPHAPLAVKRCTRKTTSWLASLHLSMFSSSILLYCHCRSKCTEGGEGAPSCRCCQWECHL